MNIIFGIIVGVGACWYLGRFLKGHLDHNQKDLPINKQTPEVNKIPRNGTGPTKTQETKLDRTSHLQSPNSDDLTRIEGIGPKISALLKTNGINTHRQLSKLDATKLAEILRDARIRVRKSDTKSWPIQANLAANARWDDLRELQEKQRRERKGQVASAA